MLRWISTSQIVFVVQQYMTLGGCIQRLPILHLCSRCEALQFRFFGIIRGDPSYIKMVECHFCTERFIYNRDLVVLHLDKALRCDKTWAVNETYSRRCLLCPVAYSSRNLQEQCERELPGTVQECCIVCRFHNFESALWITSMECGLQKSVENVVYYGLRRSIERHL